MRLFIVMLACINIVAAQPTVRAEFGRSTVYNVYLFQNKMHYDCRLPFKNIDIKSRTYGSFLLWMCPSDAGPVELWPIQTVYSIGQEFKYKHVFFRFEHYCAHPVIGKSIRIQETSGGEGVMYYNFKAAPYWWYGMQETVSIGIEYTFK